MGIFQSKQKKMRSFIESHPFNEGFKLSELPNLKGLTKEQIDEFFTKSANRTNEMEGLKVYKDRLNYGYKMLKDYIPGSASPLNNKQWLQQMIKDKGSKQEALAYLQGEMDVVTVLINRIEPVMMFGKRRSRRKQSRRRSRRKSRKSRKKRSRRKRKSRRKSRKKRSRRK